MKKKLQLAVLVIISFNAISQCRVMTENEFQSARHRLMRNSRNINTFQAAMDMGRIYCLSSSQAKNLAEYLANDRDKYDFLNSSYVNIIDKQNFTNVMDAFRLFSSAIRLYHNTLGQESINATNVNQTGSMSSNPQCNRFINQRAFTSLQQYFMNENDDRKKAAAILSQNSNCMSTSQISELVRQIRDENIQLDVLKRYQDRVFDIENYRSVANILNPRTKQIFLEFLDPSIANSNISTLNDQTSEIDFNQFLKAVKDLSFDKDREEYIRTYMKDAHLNTNQIRRLIQLLSFDSSKLSIAKFMFNNCMDPQNYFKVSEELQFSSSKKELNDYVQSQN